VLRNLLLLVWSLILAAVAAAQQPQVKVNVLNVCSPSPEEQQEIASALARLPQHPSFNQDFEVDRGRSVMDQVPDVLQGGQGAALSPGSGAADWVRIRRDFSSQAFFATVQYSFSRDSKSMVETLVFRVRDPKDWLQMAIEDSVASVTTPASMLATDTPTSRIKLERFGKPSIVLARCPGSEGSPAPDQRLYEPQFQSASAVVASYRDILGARKIVPGELVRIGLPGTSSKQPAEKSATRKTSPQNVPR